MKKMKRQIMGKGTFVGDIVDEDDLQVNLAENCIPESFMDMDYTDYYDFLEERREMMAQYIRDYYRSLG